MATNAVVMRQGEGETLNVMGAQIRFLCAADRTDQAWSLMEVVLPLHAGPPPHEHPWDEAYYVMEGKVRFVLNGQEQLVQTGDFIYAPSGTVHGFEGDSEQPARLLIFDSPAHTESFFREVDREVRGDADMAKVPAIGKRHQINFLPH
jgi:quercetin dioxygenase-like cupin family protein